MRRARASAQPAVDAATEGIATDVVEKESQLPAPPADSSGTDSSESPDALDERIRVGKRLVPPNLLFGIVAAGVIMGSLDQSINATAMPTIEHDLHTQLTWAGWTLTAYQLGMVIALPIAGRIGDQYGRKRVFMICVALFTFSSLMCGLSTSIFELIVFRALQAMGGGALMPSAVGFVTEHYGRNRDRAVGLIGATGPVGSFAGPVIGGVIIKFWTWRGIFLINLPIGVLVLILAVYFVPYREPRPGQHIDRVGIGLLVATLLPSMYAVTALGNGAHFTSAVFIVPVVMSLLIGWAFVRHARTDPSPIIPLRFLLQGSFARLNCINLLYGGTALGIGVLLPYYSQSRYGFGSLEAGTVLAARAFGALNLAWISAVMVRRLGFRRPMLWGFAQGSIAMVLLSHGPIWVPAYAWIAIGAAIMGAGGGIAAPATNNAMLHTATQDAGLISGLRGMLRQVGALSMISIATAVASRSHHPGLALGHIYFWLGIGVFVVAIPLTLSIPDHRGRW